MRTASFDKTRQQGYSISPRLSALAPALVLVVEHDTQAAHGIIEHLKQVGLRTVHAMDGRHALERHLSLRPDLVLLEVSLPRADGWTVLSEIRRRGDTAVILLTALTHDLDKLMGLRLGADDYICKPFNPEEVVARCQAVLRRARRHLDADGRRLLRTGPLLIDLDAHEAGVLHGTVPHLLPLTLTEFKLLAYLARSPQRVCTRAELLDACLPDSESMERTMDSHISKLRKKLESAGVSNCPLGVRGVGYKLWRLQDVA